MSKKFKVTARLEDGDALVVAHSDFWTHIVELYRVMGEDAPAGEREKWLEMANHIEWWVQDTLYIAPEENEEW